jgi:hypothetical protein
VPGLPVTVEAGARGPDTVDAVGHSGPEVLGHGVGLSLGEAPVLDGLCDAGGLVLDQRVDEGVDRDTLVLGDLRKGLAFREGGAQLGLGHLQGRRCDVQAEAAAATTVMSAEPAAKPAVPAKPAVSPEVGGAQRLGDLVGLSLADGLVADQSGESLLDRSTCEVTAWAAGAVLDASAGPATRKLVAPMAPAATKVTILLPTGISLRLGGRCWDRQAAPPTCAEAALRLCVVCAFGTRQQGAGSRQPAAVESPP